MLCFYKGVKMSYNARGVIEETLNFLTNSNKKYYQIEEHNNDVLIIKTNKKHRLNDDRQMRLF